MTCIFIVGPTCVGKTKLGVSISQALDGEVISVDSLQCYINGALITAQPQPDEIRDVPHHLISYLHDDEEPHDDFVSRAMHALTSIQARGKAPVFVGGSTSLLLPTLHGVLERGNDVQVFLLSPDVGSVPYKQRVQQRLEEMLSNGLVKELLELYRSEAASAASREPCRRVSICEKLIRKRFSLLQPRIASCTSGAAPQHVGVWKTIGYPEMIPYLRSVLNQEPRSDLLESGLESCAINTVRYAQHQARWIQQDLEPFLRRKGIPFSSLPVSLDMAEWKVNVERRALSIALESFYPSTTLSVLPATVKQQPHRAPVVCVFGGSSRGMSPNHIFAAKSLAAAFHAHGINLVYGGGVTGIMGEIATELVRLSGPETVHGIIPQALAQYEAKMCVMSGSGLQYDEKLHGRRTVVQDMHSRKGLMVQGVQQGGHGSGFVALSGGYGTAEELMEMLTWRQLGIHDRPVCAFNVDGLYDGLVAWLGQVSNAGFVSARDQKLLDITISAEETVDRLFQQQELNPNKLRW